MTSPTDKQQPPRHNKEIVTIKDVTTSKYDAMASSLESLTEVTVRAAEASRGSIGAIEAMGDQIKASIEEMSKSVAENICGALTTTMKEVLTQVLKNREQPATAALAVTAAEKLAGRGGGDMAATSKEKPPSGGAGAGVATKVVIPEVAAAKETLPSAGGEAGTVRVSTAKVSAPEPVFSGPSLLPTPTNQAHDKARGKQKMVGYEGEPWPTRPDGEDPWPIGPGEEDELSFADQERWMDPAPEEARLGWVSDPKSGQTGPTTEWPTGRTRID
ncbi:unnamed protein product [Linum trigynum]|uniref:Uncharacterized protein n=1 Tax=Linum trigynum TaxID=586398 RepID=A0AAV2CTD9_9ROSI